MLRAFRNLLPPLHEVRELDGPALLLELKGLLGLHPDPDDDPHGPEAAQRAEEEVGVLLPADAHDWSSLSGKNEVEEPHSGGKVSVRDTRSVGRGGDGAGDGLVGDGAEGGERKRVGKECLVEAGEFEPGLNIGDFGGRVDLRGCEVSVVRHGARMCQEMEMTEALQSATSREDLPKALLEQLC